MPVPKPGSERRIPVPLSKNAKTALFCLNTPVRAELCALSPRTGSGLSALAGAEQESPLKSEDPSEELEPPPPLDAECLHTGSGDVSQ